MEKKKRESAPESRLLPPGGACGFSSPSRQRGDRGGGGMRHIRPPPAWLGPLSPPGEGRPGFPLSPALKGQWPVRGAGRWGETRRRSHALSEGEESTLEGERGRPCSPQWALPEKRRLFAICRAAPPGKEEKRERPREQAAASRGRLWFFFFLPPKRGQRGRRDETHPAAPCLAWPAVPTGRGAAWLSLVPRSKRAMADKGSRSLGRDEGAVPSSVRWGGERSLPAVPTRFRPPPFTGGARLPFGAILSKKESWRAPLSRARQLGGPPSGEGGI